MNEPRTSDVSAELRMLLEHMLKIEASDLYMIAGSPPVFRVSDVTYPGRVPLQAHEIASMADALMSVAQRKELAERWELSFSLSLREDAHFRVSVFQQRGSCSMVVRTVRTKITTLDELGHPQLLKELALAPRGLVLVVGGFDSGKSTTLAALIDHRNTAQAGHILTVENPIEFSHAHRQCVVAQREIGTDTRSYADALRSAVHQTPDVIVIDEIRDAETLELALSFADAGHLCLSTLRSSDARATFERLLSFFAPVRHDEVRLRLSLALLAMVSQRLVPALRGGRVAALEILLATPKIKELIKRGEIEALNEAMEQAAAAGCCTVDRALLDLVCSARVSEVEALKVADNADGLRQRVERVRSGVGSAGAGAAASQAPLRLAPVLQPPPAAAQAAPGSVPQKPTSRSAVPR